MKNMTKILLLLSVFAFTQCAYFESNKAKGDCEMMTKSIDIDPFDKLEVSGGWEVQLIPSQSYNVVIQADENLIDLVMLNQNDGRLNIGAQKTIGRASDKLIKIYFTGDLKMIKANNETEVFSENDLELTSILIDVSSQAKVELSLKANDLEIEGSSKGELSLDADSKNLEINATSSADISVDGSHKITTVNASSSADVKLNGNGEIANFNATSSADINAKRFKVKSIVAKATSSGEISCYPEDELQAIASSGGNVAYHNDPSNNINSQSTSGGTVESK